MPYDHNHSNHNKGSACAKAEQRDDIPAEAHMAADTAHRNNHVDRMVVLHSR